MVRRVRPGRRDAGRRRRVPWAGPPPLLLLATVLGILVAPAVADDAPSGPAASSATVMSVARTPRSVEPHVVRQARLPSRGGMAEGGVKPIQPAVDIGVASLNMLRLLTPAQAAADARKLTADRAVDVVGWQEAQYFHGVLRSLPGWRTATFSHGGDASELAVSWRADEFRLVSAKLRRGIPGVSPDEGRYPFGARGIAVVTLAHRASGHRLTVIDAHLPTMIEDEGVPGRWASTLNAVRARQHLARIEQVWRQVDSRPATRWVVGTGDLNFDARADARQRSAGGPIKMLGRVADSSYEVLGAKVPATYPERDRRIDYVWADGKARRHDRMTFLRHWVRPDFNSDHRPIVARLRLS